MKKRSREENSPTSLRATSPASRVARRTPTLPQDTSRTNSSTYDEVQLGQGKENSKNYLRENPDLALQLENDVYKAVGMIESDDIVEDEASNKVDNEENQASRETNKKK